MEHGNIQVLKTARYYLSGPLDKSYKSICFALHGYGQLAKFFIRNFKNERLEDTLFIAPEALNRFYLSDSSGRVGATWMTKEDRLTDIDDYTAYLNAIYTRFLPQIQKVEKVGVFGFSQGVATACRWLASSPYNFDYSINWAGAFPPDLDYKAALEKTQKIPLWVLLGKEDEFITIEKYEEHIALLKNKGFDLKTQLFEGKHKIYTEPLIEVMQDVLQSPK